MLYEFIIITMKAKSGHKLYLKAGNGNACEWDKDIEEAIWFETVPDAQMFCNSYFKNFKDYQFETIEKYI